MLARKGEAQSRAEHIENLNADIAGNRGCLNRAGLVMRLALWNFFATPLYALIFSGVWAEVAAVSAG